MKQLITATIILCVVVLLTSCGSKSIDIFQYIDVEFSGIDTQGRAYVKYSDDLENALMTAAGYKDGDDPFQYLGVLLLIDAEISPNTGLTNGDKVTVKMKSNQKAFDTYKIKFTNMEKTFEVSGLIEAESIDLFSDMELVLEGASPFLRVTAKNRSQDEFLKTVQYTNDNNQNVAIGDTVTVKVSYSEAAATQRGYLVETTEKEFTIGNADEYVQKLADIDASTISRVLKEATDKMEAEFNRNASTIFYRASGNSSFVFNRLINPNAIEIGTPYPMAIYLLSLKSGERLDPNLKGSAVFVVFKTHGVSRNGSEAEIYTVVAIPNVIKNTDGTITVSYADSWLCNHYGLDEDTVYERNIKPFESKFNIDRIDIA